MQTKSTTQTLATTGSNGASERIRPESRKGDIVVPQASKRADSERSPAKLVRFMVRLAGVSAFILYVGLSQHESDGPAYRDVLIWLRWGLLILIGWYGWWETSLQMKGSRQPAGIAKSLNGFVRRDPARISLIPQTPEHLRTLLEGVDIYQSRFQVPVADGVRDFLAGPEVSAEFLARLKEPAPPDPWKDGFAILHLADNRVIGLCGFSGPPSVEGAVEIAYGVAPGYQNRGLAGEAAQELIAYALASGQVRTVRAHTLPENNASTRVLTRCGFVRTGEVRHPEDGVVWRWEMAA